MSDGQRAESAPLRVVVLGGGAAGTAAAYWLTAPEQENRFQVTLYTQGWRLGGKCASGRNAACSSRIEEHGLHMLMGCYQNAFATLRACYADWKPPASSPIQTWQDAFLPQRQVTLMEQDGDGGSWSPWNFADLPRFPGEPGDDLLNSGLLSGDVAADAQSDDDGRLLLKLADWLENFISIRDLIDGGREVIEALREAVANPASDSLAAHASRLKAANVLVLRAIKDPVFHLALRLARRDHSVSRLLILANLGIAMGVGFIADILGRGEAAYAALNRLDFREWLRRWGAADEALASAPIRALYDLAFAFPNGAAGDINNGSIAAGVSIRFGMEMVFGYRDAPLWKMAAGMGDTVFTPLYQVLEARAPMTVRFFHRVMDLRAGSDGRIAEIDLSLQAETVDGSPYRPLVEVNGLACWPSRPDWDQLQNGRSLQQQGVNFEASYWAVSVGSTTLRVGRDFDIVILAMPPAAIGKMAQSFVQGSQKWQDALGSARSVATQSLQLWMWPTVEALGWTLGPTVLTAFAEDYDSWGDMSHLLSAECWGRPDAPQSIAYFCGCMALPAGRPDPGGIKNVAVANANRWMQSGLAALWPNNRGGLVSGRYDLANFDGSDLYVQTPGGTNVESRFSSSQPAVYSNLYVVGDWTLTRFSGGCFESAIESGMLASRAISGFPAHIKTK